MENRITVFVPTYNRLDRLPVLLNSLKAQDYKLFELLIIDDGSTDATESLIAEWILKDEFKIRYVYQKNSGKHIAYNKAIKEATTELFVELDSDDYFKPNALGTLVATWDNCVEDKEVVGSIQYLYETVDGVIIGDHFVKTITDNYELREIDKIRGDKGMLYDTFKLKKFSMPSHISGSSGLLSILHNRFSSQYKVYCLNESLQIVEYLDSGITLLNQKNKNPRYESMLIRYNEFNFFNISSTKYIYYNSKYVKISLLLGSTIKEIFSNAINRKGIFVVSFIHGYLTYLVKKIKIKLVK